MSTAEEGKSFGRGRLSFADEADIDEFVDTLSRYERGELTPDQWRAFRLVRGTYGQRQQFDAQMLRVKIPQGILTASQLTAMGEASEKYSRGFGHITTRQNIQLHFVKLHDVELAMRDLAAAGLTTREACGNSVRNITACPYAGVAKDEPFDVTPYAEAMTRYLLRHPLSASLPRKFKIAFEGCATDHAVTPINDLGFHARVRTVNGQPQRGFRVTAGGGTAILCRTGGLLEEFLPAEEIFNLAEAVVRVFHQRGDRAHKQRNRMKFLIKELGWDGWKAEVEKALAAFRADGGANLPFDAQRPPEETAPNWERPAAPTVAATASRAQASPVKGPGIVPTVLSELRTSSAAFERFLRTNVRPQRQPGYSAITVNVVLGDFTGEQMRLLGELASAYGEGSVRMTVNQDLVLRWVRTSDLPEVHARLAAMGLGLPDADTVADVLSCPGAEACRLAVTQSRGLGKVLGDFLRSRPDLVDAVPDLDIKISGCPNGCGQHHIAGIGFQGSVRKLGDKVLPQYFLMLGGGAAEDTARFARIAAKVPARRIVAAVERLIGFYLKEREPGEKAKAFFERVELPRVKPLLADLEQISLESAAPEDFIDLAETTEFKQETMDGECAA